MFIRSFYLISYTNLLNKTNFVDSCRLLSPSPDCLVFDQHIKYQKRSNIKYDILFYRYQGSGEVKTFFIVSLPLLFLADVAGGDHQK